MNRVDKEYTNYISILNEELLTAMGCTEPIAIAYAAAKAKDTLGLLPDRVQVQASANIIKNVKSVVVPGTGGLRGIEVAAAAGIVAGDAGKVLEVISSINDSDREQIRAFLGHHEINVSCLQSDQLFDLIVTVFKGDATAAVRLSQHHTNIVLIEKDHKVVYKNEPVEQTDEQGMTDRSFMTVKGILEFAEAVELEDVASILRHQINCNSRIAEEGLKGDWGANIGSVLLKEWGDSIQIRAKAKAAAASDARMSGCGLPVVIVSGSGNQGITASLPVIEYAGEMNVPEDELLRALVVSNLVTIHQKTGIGRLSAFCGAVSAGVGAAAGIAWLHGCRYVEIAHTIVNSLASVSGIICDGAKPSCAAKIAAAVEAGILGFKMWQNGHQFYGGDGIVIKGVENTIASVGRLGRYGMSETDKEIIRIMLGTVSGLT